MLSVAAASTAVHCSETPNSSSSHSGLVTASTTGTWNSDHSPLKRKQSLQRCTSPIRDLTSDYGFSSEITLTLVSADANGYKRRRRDSEKSLNSGVTLRYKDPKTMAPTEKMLDNDVRLSFDTSGELSLNSLIKKPIQEPEHSGDSSVNGILEKISSEITIYPKQESERQYLHIGVSTSNKSANQQIFNNSQTVIRVSQEVDIISSKSSQRVNRKSGCKQVEAIIVAAKKDVPEDNAKSETSLSVRVRTFDTNNNPSQGLVKERFKTKMNKALQHIEGLGKASTSIANRAAIDENQMILPSRSRERLESNEQWNDDDFFGNDSSMQGISSSMPFTEQIYNFGDEFSSGNPYFVVGFPNPPGENRCWVNATIHALFALPFTDSLDTLNLPECTQLMKTLLSIQTLWRKGESEKHKIHQLLRKFKEELIVLDESYPSERQQDVSEFLMKLLNHLKAYFEKLLSGDAKIQEIENVPENPQDHRKSKTTDSTKRRPLVELRRNSNLSEPGTSPKSQKVERLPNSTEASRETSENEATKNPIDEYFLLPIVDQYVCKGCSEKKQKQVDNLVVFIQVPSESKDVPVNVEDAIARNFTTEERRVTCENCKHEFQDVRTAFSSHPKILTVHVHRYGVGEHGTRKISNALSIPERLVLKSSLMIEGFEADEVYKPVCIISHVGENVDCGHYTSYVEHEGQWYHYNDMSVYPMTSCEVFEAAETTAYLIFFVNVNLLEKRNTDFSKTHFN